MYTTYVYVNELIVVAELFMLVLVSGQYHASLTVSMATGGRGDPAAQ